MTFNLTSNTKSLLSILSLCCFVLALQCKMAQGQFGVFSGEVTYTSTAKIFIETVSEAPNTKTLPHDKAIASKMIVEKCFHETAQLLRLKSFDDLPKTDVTENVLSKSKRSPTI